MSKKKIQIKKSYANKRKSEKKYFTSDFLIVFYGSIKKRVKHSKISSYVPSKILKKIFFLNSPSFSFRFPTQIL